MGTYVDPAAGKVTLRNYAEQWRAVQVDRPSTAAQIETNLRRHVYPTFGDRPLASIRRSEIQGWVKGCTDLGHASAAETLDTYSHLWPDSEDRTRQAVDDVLGARKPVPAGDSRSAAT